jgi:8-oxo-dGTP diphosphatase
MKNRPKVGVGVLIIKDSKVLLGKRKNAHGDGMWSPPGGHLEFGESFETCAKREVLEETGIEVLNMKKCGFTNDVFINENKHYVSIFMLVDKFCGEPKILEPEKCECWSWFDFDKLPENLFLPLKNFIEQEDLSMILG